MIMPSLIEKLLEGLIPSLPPNFIAMVIKDAIANVYDIEIFPNLFSVTFVDMSSYFKTFSDCVDAKGKPIALTEKLSVAEIKERLNRVESKIFWISDTDDSH